MRKLVFARTKKLFSALHQRILESGRIATLEESGKLLEHGVLASGTLGPLHGVLADGELVVGADAGLLVAEEAVDALGDALLEDLGAVLADELAVGTDDGAAVGATELSDDLNDEEYALSLDSMQLKK